MSPANVAVFDKRLADTSEWRALRSFLLSLWLRSPKRKL
jgi:hypothetical protein